MWQIKGAQPPGGRVFSHFNEKRRKYGIEEPGKRAYHYQYLKPDHKVEHNDTTEDGFPIHLKPPVFCCLNNSTPCWNTGRLSAEDRQDTGGFMGGSLKGLIYLSDKKRK